jgi:tetratricopeptide (TPR) repeat protein
MPSRRQFGSTISLALGSWHVVFVLLISVVLTIPDQSQSARIELKNGKIITGSVVAQTSSTLSVLTAVGILSLDRTEIRAILLDEPSCLDEVEILFQKGEIQNALELVTGRCRGELLNPRLIAKLEHEFDRIRSAAQQNPPLILKYVKEIFEAVLSPANVEFDSKCIALAAEIGETTTVVEMLSTVLRDEGAAKVFTNSNHAYDVITWLNGSSEQNVEIIGSLLREFLSAPNGTTTVTKEYLYRLYESEMARLIASRTPRKALTELDKDIDILPPSLATTLLTQTMAIANDESSTETLYSISDLATSVCLRLPLCAATKDILRQQVITLVRNNRLGEAKQIVDDAEKKDVDFAAELNILYTFYSRHVSLSPSDYAAKYRLAKWALQMGLESQAQELLRELTKVPEVSKVARLYLESIELQQMSQQLQRARQAMFLNRLAEAEKILADVKKSRAATRLSTEVLLMTSLIDYRKKITPESRREESLALLQQAERFIMQRRFHEAQECIDQAVYLTPDEPIVRRAKILRQRLPMPVSR